METFKHKIEVEISNIRVGSTYYEFDYLALIDGKEQTGTITGDYSSKAEDGTADYEGMWFYLKNGHALDQVLERLE